MIRQLGVITGSLALAACTTSGPANIAARDAQLTEAGSTGPAEYAWYSTIAGLQYEAYRQIDGKNRWHHLDVMDLVAKRGELVLEPGRVYLGGPAVTGSNNLGDHVGPDGQLLPSVPRPWIDLVTCNGDIMAGPASCRSGDRIEVTVEDLGSQGQRVTYRAVMPDEQAPSVAGTFIAEPGTLRGTPR